MIWNLIAKLITRPAITNWLIERAKRTPYQHITSADGQHVYMGRWRLFNAYPGAYGDHPQPRHIPWLPSVRIHHICRADQDRDLHDHPWNARTIVLRGWYREERPLEQCSLRECRKHDGSAMSQGGIRLRFERRAGYTGRLLFGQYHRISEVSEGGVWTLFITGRKRGTWGFMVNGKKVPWRTYLGLDSQEGGAA